MPPEGRKRPARNPVWHRYAARRRKIVHKGTRDVKVIQVTISPGLSGGPQGRPSGRPIVSASGIPGANQALQSSTLSTLD